MTEVKDRHPRMILSGIQRDDSSLERISRYSMKEACQLPVRLFLAVCLSAATLSAESTPLRWEDCLRIAAANNPVLGAARSATAAARARVEAAKNRRWPSLGLSHGVERGGRSGDGATATETSWSAQADAGLRVVDLADGAAIRGAAAAADRSSAAQTAASAQALRDLRTAFAGLLYAQEQEDLSASIEALWRANARMVALRYESGRESKGNQMRIDAQHLQAQAAVAQSVRDRRVARRTLARTLGRAEGEDLVVAGAADAAPPVDGIPDFQSLAEAVPAVRSARAQWAEAQADQASARSAFWPTLTLTAARGWTGPTAFPQATRTWSWGGRLRLPIFADGPTASFANARAARNRTEEAKASWFAARLQALEDLESAWAAWAEARDGLRVQSAFRDAARQRRREADVRYQSGLMSFEEWQIVVNELVNGEKNVLSAQRNTAVAEAAWRHAQGEGL
jgi:outer membrane protein TolC